MQYRRGGLANARAPCRYYRPGAMLDWGWPQREFPAGIIGGVRYRRGALAKARAPCRYYRPGAMLDWGWPQRESPVGIIGGV